MERGLDSFEFGPSVPMGGRWRLLGAVDAFLEEQRHRLALFVPVGLGCGIAFWFAGAAANPWVVVSLVFAFIAAGFMARGRRLGALLLGAALTIGIGYGAMALRSHSVEQPVLDYPWTGSFYGRIVSVEPIPARGQTRLVLDTEGGQGLPPRVRLNVEDADYDVRLRAGAVIAMRARLVPPARATLPGGYDFSQRAWFLGLGATGSALSAPVVVEAAAREERISDARQELARNVQSRIGGDEGAIAATFATGDRGAISEPTAEALRSSGLAHLLAISGLHVTAIVGFLYLISVRVLALWPWLALRINVRIAAGAISACGAVGYTLLTGAQVPTIRACVAALLILLAMAIGRQPLTLRLIAAGATLILLIWPESLVGPSFQLSFAAVTAIVALHESSWMRDLAEWSKASLVRRVAGGIFALYLTGLAVEVAIAPIALYHFHSTGLFGAFANIIAIPLTTFVIIPLEALALLLEPTGLVGPIWSVVGSAIGLLIDVARTVEATPHSRLILPSSGLWPFLLAVSGGALLAMLLVGRARLFGLPLFVVGIGLMIAAPKPDLLLGGDARHLGLVDAGGRLWLLRPKAGEYVRDMFAEGAASQDEALALPEHPDAHCSEAYCFVRWEGGEGATGTILATRSSRWIEDAELQNLCSKADIVISDRAMPKSCEPRWLKLDKRSVRETGGVALYFESRTYRAVKDGLEAMPWADPPRAHPVRPEKPRARSDRNAVSTRGAEKAQ